MGAFLEKIGAISDDILRVSVGTCKRRKLVCGKDGCLERIGRERFNASISSRLVRTRVYRRS